MIDDHDDALFHNNSCRHTMMDFMVINRVLKSILKNSCESGGHVFRPI